LVDDDDVGEVRIGTETVRGVVVVVGVKLIGVAVKMHENRK